MITVRFTAQSDFEYFYRINGDTHTGIKSSQARRQNPTAKRRETEAGHGKAFKGLLKSCFGNHVASQSCHISYRL